MMASLYFKFEKDIQFEDYGIYGKFYFVVPAGSYVIHDIGIEERFRINDILNCASYIILENGGRWKRLHRDPRGEVQQNDNVKDEEIVWMKLSSKDTKSLI